MDKEEREYDIYYTQGCKCFLCSEDLSGWIVKPIDGIQRVVCWPNCNQKISAPIRIELQHLK